MPRVGSTWVVELTCASCEQRFSVKGVPIASVSRAPEVTACPHCSYDPRQSTHRPFDNRQHLIFALAKDEKDSK